MASLKKKNNIWKNNSRSVVIYKVQGSTHKICKQARASEGVHLEGCCTDEKSCSSRVPHPHRKRRERECCTHLCLSHPRPNPIGRGKRPRESRMRTPPTLFFLCRVTDIVCSIFCRRLILFNMGFAIKIFKHS